MPPHLIEDRDGLEKLLDHLAAELHRRDVSADVVMVGGAWMLWHTRRAATYDVDSARRLDPAMVPAIKAVGIEHGVSDDWLNDSAAPFWPSGTSLDECEPVYEREALVVRAAPPEVVFVMKLYRAHPQDREDMVSLWPMCDFDDPEAAVASFEKAYPHAPEDKHLVEYVRDIARDASAT